MSTKLFITLGPSTVNKEFLSNIDKKHVKLLRINLSHTDLSELSSLVKYIRKYTNIDICFDTEGAQIRTSKIKGRTRKLSCNETVYINKSNILNNHLTLLPKYIYEKLNVNDILSIDFNNALMKIIGESKNRFKCKVMESGIIGTNKSVSVKRRVKIPAFTEKDLEAFKIAQKLKIKHIALSFTSNHNDINKLRSKFSYDINVTSKIESRNGLKNLQGILKEADNILIDRGDLSKEIPLHEIPKTQKKVISTAKKFNTPVFVATNLLESMVTCISPTRAEVNDVYNTLIDGADGLVLAAETAIGKYPEKCIEMILKISKTIK